MRDEPWWIAGDAAAISHDTFHDVSRLRCLCMLYHCWCLILPRGSQLHTALNQLGWVACASTPSIEAPAPAHIVDLPVFTDHTELLPPDFTALTPARRMARLPTSNTAMASSKVASLLKASISTMTMRRRGGGILTIRVAGSQVTPMGYARCCSSRQALSWYGSP